MPVIDRKAGPVVAYLEHQLRGLGEKANAYRGLSSVLGTVLQGLEDAKKAAVSALGVDLFSVATVSISRLTPGKLFTMCARKAAPRPSSVSAGG